MSKPGIYLHLYHGRNHPDLPLANWGHGGPVVGSFSHFVATYWSTFRLGYDKGEWWLGDSTHEDLLYYDGMFYGDFSLISPEGLARLSSSPELFDPVLTKLPEAIPPFSREILDAALAMGIAVDAEVAEQKLRQK